MLTRKCAYVGCGKPFKATAGNQRYCCPECMLKAKRLRDSAAYEARKATAVKPKSELCKKKDKCYYGELVGSTWVCQYILIERKPRGCSGIECKHFRKKGAKRGCTKIKETKETC